MNQKNSGKVKRREKTPVHISYQPPRILLPGIHLDWAMPAPLEGPWVRVIGQRHSGHYPHHHETWDYEPHGRAVHLGSNILLLSTWLPLPNKVSCFVSTCISLDNSFPNIRQEPTYGPWKESSFLQHLHENF